MKTVMQSFQNETEATGPRQTWVNTCDSMEKKYGNTIIHTYQDIGVVSHGSSNKRKPRIIGIPLQSKNGMGMTKSKTQRNTLNTHGNTTRSIGRIGSNESSKHHTKKGAGKTR